MDAISVVVATYGAEMWKETAQRALASAAEQSLGPHEVLHEHGSTLAEARNDGARRATGDWLLFLDADDELDHNYISAMTGAIRAHEDRPVLFQPATLGVVDGVEDSHPVVIPKRDIKTGNYMVIGTLVERDLFNKVGGFLEWPLYEDWCLWIRCMQNGAESIPVPCAVYRVHVNPNGRNNPDRDLQVKVYNDIRRKHGLR